MEQFSPSGARSIGVFVAACFLIFAAFSLPVSASVKGHSDLPFDGDMLAEASRLNAMQTQDNADSAPVLRFVDDLASFGVVLPGEELSLSAEIESLSDGVSIDSLGFNVFGNMPGPFSVANTDCVGQTLNAGERCSVTLQASSRVGGPLPTVGLIERALSVTVNGSHSHSGLTVFMTVVPAKPDLDAEWTLGNVQLREWDVIKLGTMFDLLSVFYYRMGGNNWANNSGWLDPEVHPCDWYGVSCRYRTGLGGPPPPVPRVALYSINLSANQVSGWLTSFKTLDRIAFGRESAPYAPIYPTSLDLSHNVLAGIERIPSASRVVVLDNVGLGGSLPAVESRWVDPGLWANPLEALSLAGNTFNGGVPASWAWLSLAALDLTENAFSGSLLGFDEIMGVKNLNDEQALYSVLLNHDFYYGMPWFRGSEIGPFVQNSDSYEAARYVFPVGLQVAGNDLSELGAWTEPESIIASACWNDLTIEADASLFAVNEGGPDELVDCQSVDRQAPSAAVSGSWYSPERDGEGMNLMLLPDGSPIAVWYLHAEAGRQVWMLGQGQSLDKTLRLSPMTSFSGAFGRGFDTEGVLKERYPEYTEAFGLMLQASVLSEMTLGISQMAWFEENELQARAADAGQTVLDFGETTGNPYDGVDVDSGNVRDLLSAGVTRPLTRLTSIAGTSCDTQHQHQWVSGLWYEPESAGEGLVIEYTSNDQAVVYWYTYTPDGSEQAWMLGVGTFDGQRLVVENMRQPQHTGEVVFDTAGIEQNVTWGSLEIDFSDESNGLMSYSSVMDGYGSGTRELTRLARPMMASGCEASVH